MLTALDKRQMTMVVGSAGAPFIGISGRQMATVECGTELITLGEHGPYTIVHWDGRNGYVQTDLLVTPEAFQPGDVNTDDGDTDSKEDTTRSKRFRFFPWRQRAA